MEYWSSFTCLLSFFCKSSHFQQLRIDIETMFSDQKRTPTQSFSAPNTFKELEFLINLNDDELL